MRGDSYETPPEPFRTELSPHRETVVIAAFGEIDIEAAGQLDERMNDLLGRGFERVVLDLRGVTFIDSTGLHAILHTNSASAAAGVRFAIVQGPAPVERLFELTQTVPALHFIDEREINLGGC